jgi:hypothetical protein
VSILRKITHGYVVQVLETESLRFISQEFVAGDDVECINEDDEVVLCPLNTYLPFDMVQP